MLETIVVLVIIGVLSAMVTGVISQTNYVSEVGEAEQMRLDLRFAQQRAIGSIKNIKVKVSSIGDWYRMPRGMMFINGKRSIRIQSDLRNGRDVIFEAQTGMPDNDYALKLGENQVIYINGQTGMIK